MEFGKREGVFVESLIALWFKWTATDCFHCTIYVNVDMLASGDLIRHCCIAAVGMAGDSASLPMQCKL